MLSSLLDQYRLLSAASAGDTAALRVYPLPSYIRRLLRLMVTEETGIFTVTAHSALTPLPSAAVAVIMAVPAFTAVTLPSLSTLTISGALLDQERVCKAPSGYTVALRVWLSPLCKLRSVLLMSTLVTAG